MNFRQKSIVAGAVIGAAMGALGGYLFTRGVDLPRKGAQPQGLSLRSVPPGEVVKVFIGMMAVLRGLAELGEHL